MRVATRVPLVLATAGLLLAACGSSATSFTKSAGSANTHGSSSLTSHHQGRRFRHPVAAGEIVGVSGNTMTLSTRRGTTTVDWTPSTTITTTVTIPVSSIPVGSCVSLRHIPTSNTLTPDVEDLSISIFRMSGACKSGFRSFPGKGNFPGKGRGFPGRGEGFGYSGVVGKVKAVTPTSIVIELERSSRIKTIPITTSTTATEREKGSSADLVQGQCALVDGTKSSGGTVSASSIAISGPISGVCRPFVGFHRRGYLPGATARGRSSSGVAQSA